MVDTIDVHELSKEQIAVLQEFVEFLKKRDKAKSIVKKKAEHVKFATWSLGAKGKISREEIYDHL